MSFPNQKKIIINKPKYDKDYVESNGAFMQIGIEEWQDAYNAFKGNSTAIALYFYLASNADQHKKDLSFEAFSNCINRSKSSYHRAVELLTENGYLYEDNCGRLNFATIPKEGLRTATQNWEEEDAKKKLPIVKDEIEKSQNCNASNSEMTIETDNKEDKENKEIDIDQKKIEKLKHYVTPQGQIKYGKAQGWLNYYEPKFWELSTDEKVKIVRAKTDLSWEDARIVVEHILHENEYNKAMALFKSMGF